MLAAGCWLLAAASSLAIASREERAAAKNYRGRYVLLKPLRVLVTVKVPSACAETLIMNAGPV